MRGSAVCAVAFVLACSTSAAPEAVDPVRASCAAFALSWCESKRSCLSAEFASEYQAVDTCVERQTLQCESSRFGPGSTLTPDDVRACGQVLSEGDLDARCTRWLRWERMRDAPAACTKKGHLQQGSLCLLGSQCETGHCSPHVRPCGACRTPAELGDLCFEDGDCASGRACSAGGKCVAYISTGACDEYKPCLPWLACVAHECVPRAKEGGPCNQADGCELWPEQLVCNPGTGRCERYASAGAGEACGEVDQGPVTLCAPGLVCEVVDTPRRGVCVAAKPDRYGCVQEPQALPKRFPFGGPCLAPALCATTGRCGVLDVAMCEVAPFQ